MPSKLDFTVAAAAMHTSDAVRERAAAIAEYRKVGLPTVPVLLGDELATNPFLRALSAAAPLREHTSRTDPLEIFSSLRREKDSF